MSKKRLQLEVTDSIDAFLKKMAVQQGRTVTDLVKEGIIAVCQRYGKGEY